MCQRLIHDIAFKAAKHIVEVFAGLLRDEEVRDAVTEVFDRVKSCLEEFVAVQANERRKLNPFSKN